MLVSGRVFQFAPEKLMGLEDDPFLLGFGHFSGGFSTVPVGSFESMKLNPAVETRLVGKKSRFPFGGLCLV